MEIQKIERESFIFHTEFDDGVIVSQIERILEEDFRGRDKIISVTYNTLQIIQ